MASPNVNMDAVEALHVALQQSFSPDASIRDPAEASIKHLKFVPGSTQMLLHITEEKQVRCLSSICNIIYCAIFLQLGFLESLRISCSRAICKYLFRFNMRSAKPQPFSSKTSAVNAGLNAPHIWESRSILLEPTLMVPQPSRPF